MKITVQEKHVVTLTYNLKTDSGDLVDQATIEKPFAFIHGIGTTLPAFDAGLVGKEAGESFEFSIDSANGYGEHDSQKIQNLDRGIFAEAPEGTLTVGNTLPMQYNDPGNSSGAQTIYGTIAELTENAVKMDFNHPLAGQNLNFSGTIIGVRKATSVELEHGHAHGPGGHEH